MEWHSPVYSMPPAGIGPNHNEPWWRFFFPYMSAPLLYWVKSIVFKTISRWTSQWINISIMLAAVVNNTNTSVCTYITAVQPKWCMYLHFFWSIDLILASIIVGRGDDSRGLGCTQNQNRIKFVWCTFYV